MEPAASPSGIDAIFAAFNRAPTTRAGRHHEFFAGLPRGSWVYVRMQDTAVATQLPDSPQVLRYETGLPSLQSGDCFTAEVLHRGERAVLLKPASSDATRSAYAVVRLEYAGVLSVDWAVPAASDD